MNTSPRPSRGPAPRGRERHLVFLVTSEHGGNRVPLEYQDLFRRAGPALASHRGWDAGTVALARALVRDLRRGGVEVAGPPRVSTVTRLLVDLNRSAHNPRVWSEWTRTLPPAERRTVLERYHTPHRRAVADDVAAWVEQGRTVVHLGVHSFTPVLDGRARSADLALLYDPARPGEQALARDWARGLQARLPELRVRRNQPYRGASDGLTTWLRRRTPAGRYLGIEIEVNQRLVDAGGRFPRNATRALADAAVDAVRGRGPRR